MKEDSDTKNTEKEEKKGTRAYKFLEKLDFVRLPQNEDEGTKDSKAEKSDQHDPHAFPMISDFLSPQKIKEIKSGKSKLLMIIGISVGLLLIVLGAISMMGSADRIADNVVFGEKEVFSVFLILVGIILIASSLAYKFLGKSFFKEIEDDVESHNKKSSSSTKTDTKKDNINRDNK